MRSFSILPQRSFRDGDSHRVLDLVVFYRYLYEYWYHRGQWNAMLTRIVDFVNCVIIWWLVFVLGLMFEWDGALSCEGIKCAEIPLIHSPRLPETHNLAVFVFLCASGAAVLWELRRCIEGYFLLKEVHEYLRHLIRVGSPTPVHSFLFRLRVWYHSRGANSEFGGHQLLDGDDDESLTFAGSPSGARNPLGTIPSIADISWSEYLRIVCGKLQQDKGITEYRSMDELKVVQTMMLIDNFKVALHHHGVLSTVPLCFADDNIITLLLEAQMEGYRIGQGGDAERHLKERLFLRTLISFLAFPFVISFMLTKFLVKGVAELRANPSQLFHRSWSTTAQWRFRLYNEVSHLAQSRLQKGTEVAELIVNRASAARESPVLRVLQRASAAVVLVIVFATTINTTLLSYGVVFGKTLFWWLSLAVIVFGAASGAEVLDREYNHQSDLSKLVSFTHYEHREWHRSPSTFVQSILPELFPRRIYSSFVSLLSVVLNPFLLLWIYRSDALKHMLIFVQQNNKTVTGIGSVCSQSTFNWRDFGRSESMEDALEGAVPANGSPNGNGSLAAKRSENDTEPQGTRKRDLYQNLDAHNQPSESLGDLTEDAATGEELRPMGAKKADATAITVPPEDDAAGMIGRGVESFEWKVEKSIVAFAAIYPAWLLRHRQSSSDDLGIKAALMELDRRVMDEVELPSPTIAPQAGVAVASAAFGRGGGEHRPGPVPASQRHLVPDDVIFQSIGPGDETSRLNQTSHERETLNVAMVDALQRSTWLPLDPTAGGASGRFTARDRMPRTGSYGSAREINVPSW